MIVHFTKKTLCIYLTLTCVLAVTLQAGDWPNWRGPDYDGISKETGWDPAMLKDGVEPLWKASLGTGFSAVAVSNGKVFAMGNTAKSKGDPEQLDVVYCFDAVAGKELWTHIYVNQLDPKHYEGGTLASPTVDAGKVYTVSKDGKAFCLDAKTGDVIWEKNVLDDFGIKRATWGISGSPLIVDKIISP